MHAADDFAGGTENGLARAVDLTGNLSVDEEVAANQRARGQRRLFVDRDVAAGLDVFAAVGPDVVILEAAVGAAVRADRGGGVFADVERRVAVDAGNRAVVRRGLPFL